MTTVVCYFCNESFKRKYNLIRHLDENRCKQGSKMSLLDFHMKLEDSKNEFNKIIEDLKKNLIHIHGNNNDINIQNLITNNILFNIQINPINKLSLDHVSTDKMKEIIESYDNDKSKLVYLLTNYMNGLLCDKKHPENHAVKYTKKYPPTFNSLTEDIEGNLISNIKGLKDTCELLSDPVLDVLKGKLMECIKKYKNGTEINYDYSLYQDAIKELKKELKKDNIKKVLSNFLKNDLINNIEMKIDMTNNRSVYTEYSIDEKPIQV